MLKQYQNLIGVYFFAPLALYAVDELSTIDISQGLDTPLQQHPSGQTHIEQSTIKSFPKANGDINEVLKYLPDVKADISNKKTSYNAGEIEPENISISGGAFYQNNFQIDNISNNSLLDPANKNVYNENDVKGHSQEIFLDTDMIKSIDLYDSDVPAKFGRFTGGVIDTKTKHATSHFKAKLKYRFSSDQLTHFFPYDEDTFNESRDANVYQPKFKKDFYSASFTIPLTQESAIYTNITIKDSIIPILHFNTTKNEYRKSNNYFMKYSTFFDNGDILDYTFSYNTYDEQRFRADVKESDFNIKGGGLKTYLNHEHENALFKIESALAYSDTKNERQAPQNYYKWATSDTINHGNLINDRLSYVGGFGDLVKEQTIFTLKSDLSFKNNFELGFELQYGNAIFNREEESALYKVAIIKGVPTNNGLSNLRCLDQEGCVNAEQYANQKNVYHAFKTDVELSTQAFYMQKKLSYENLLLRVGARYDHNNYMNNHDLAYRSTSSYDLFNDKNSVLSLGFNRYYANSFLTYKLREAKKPYITYTRALLGKTDAYNQQYLTPGEWEENSRRGTAKTRYSDLKTPYSDEKSIAFKQKLFGGVLLVKQIFRNKKNGFSKIYAEVEEDGYRYYSLTNKGYSKHESTRIKYDIASKKHYLNLSINRSSTSVSNLNYDDKNDDDTDTNLALYNNKLTRLSNIDLSKNTDPIVAKLLYKYTYNNSFNLSSFVQYTSTYKKIETFETQPIEIYNKQKGIYEIQDIPLYNFVHHKAITKANLSLEYKHKVGTKNTLYFRTDILNIFNAKEKIYQKNKYTLGRQFWLETAYHF